MRQTPYNPESVERLVAAAKEVRDGLIAEINDNYPEVLRKQYPTYERRWVNEMACVVNLNEALAALTQQPVSVADVERVAT